MNKSTMGHESIQIEATKVTPSVIMQEGFISIRGRSIPDDASDFYKPMQKWIRAYVGRQWEKTRVVFSFEYINTSSTKWIYNIIKELAQYPDVSNKVSVEWYYEKGDEELYELGRIIHSFINCPFLFFETEQS